MSANTPSYHGRVAASAGMYRPARAIVAAKPRAVRVAVLPPVLGPVTTAARFPVGTITSTGRGLAGARVAISSGWRRDSMRTSSPSDANLGLMPSTVELYLALRGWEKKV